jgi:hypothetical protein
MKLDPYQLGPEFHHELHPDVRALVLALDAWCLKEGLPEVVVVGLSRTPERNAQVGGAANSYHLSGCAADLRNHHYEPHELARVETWLRSQCPPALFELITKPHGQGAHLHIARKDRLWRKENHDNGTV